MKIAQAFVIKSFYLFLLILHLIVSRRLAVYGDETEE